MANTLTGLIPQINEAMDVVSRELTGAIPAVSRNTAAERAAKDQTIRIPVTASESIVSISPGLYAPDSGDATTSYVDMTISKAYMVPIRYNGEEDKGLNNSGIRGSIFADRVAQGMRALVNQIEADILGAAYKGASRAYGTAGTTPFASSLDDAAQIKKILDDNGAPQAGRALIVDTAAGVKLRGLTHLTQQYAAGTDATLRQGTLLDIFGFAVKESSQVQYHTKGTMTGSDCTAIEPVGEVTVACDGSNSGTVLAGDIVTRGVEGGSSADANKYVIYSGSTLTGNAAGNFIVNKPGLLVATAATDEWTIGSSYRANVAFSKNAIQLVTRFPAMPDGGDAADDVYEIMDPLTGLTFQICMYKQYKQVHYEVGIAWGYQVIKPEHIAILLG